MLWTLKKNMHTYMYDIYDILYDIDHNFYILEIHADTHTYRDKYLHTYLHTDIYTYTQTNIHTFTHKYIHNRSECNVS